MNDFNTYGYAVFSNSTIQLHVVEARCSMYAGLSVFNNALDAIAWITILRTSYCRELKYNHNYHFNIDILKWYVNKKSRLFSDLATREIYTNGLN